MSNEKLNDVKARVKKGFDLFKVHPQLLYSRGFDIEEPTCCEVCKGCLFNIGKLICKYRNATYIEAKFDRLLKRINKRKKRGRKNEQRRT